MMEVAHASLNLTNTANGIPESAVYVINLTTYLHSLVNTPDRFQLLARIMVDTPKHYKVIYFVCDTNNADSLKQAEHTARGSQMRMFREHLILEHWLDLDSLYAMEETKRE